MYSRSRSSLAGVLPSASSKNVIRIFIFRPPFQLFWGRFVSNLFQCAANLVLRAPIQRIPMQSPLRSSQNAAIAVQFFAFPLLYAAALSNTKPLPFRPTARLSLPSHCSTTLYSAFSRQSTSVHTIASASLFFSGAVQTISFPLLSCPVRFHSSYTRYISLSAQFDALFFRRHDIQCKPSAQHFLAFRS